MSQNTNINWKEYYIKPPKPQSLEGTPFYIGSLNMIYGLSKVGKSRTLAEMLSKANTDKTIVWLDKDYNIDEPLLEILAKFKHVNHDVDALCHKLLNKDTLEEYILVFDSLKDFSGHGLDSNSDAQKSMEYIRQFTKLGATVILIAHATVRYLEDGKDNGYKIQGNSETIQSKCDCVFRFDVSESKNHKIIIRSFTPERMRISNASKDVFSMYDREELIKVIHSLIDEDEHLTKRELKKRFSSSIEMIIDSLEGVAYTVEKVGRSKIVRKILS